MHRSQHDHALDQPPGAQQFVVGMRRNASRIDIARVRHDQHLGMAEPRLEGLDSVEQLVDLAQQGLGIGGIKGAGDGGRSDCAHSGGVGMATGVF